VRIVGPGAIGAAWLEKLSRHEQLRVVQLDDVVLRNENLKVPGRHVRWLGLARVDTPEVLRLELSPLRLVRMHWLAAFPNCWPDARSSSLHQSGVHPPDVGYCGKLPAVVAMCVLGVYL
jgi:hypothetical protein